MNSKIKIVSIVTMIFILTIGIVIFNRFFYFGEYIKISGTNIYHRDSCMFVKKAGIDKLKLLPTLYSTAELNLRPCNTCHPPDNSKYANEVAAKKKEAELKAKKKADLEKAARIEQSKKDYLEGKPIGVVRTRELKDAGFLTAENINKRQQYLKEHGLEDRDNSSDGQNGLNNIFNAIDEAVYNSN